MKCYVINLERSPDRLTHIRERLASLDVQFERITAVDGQHLSGDFGDTPLTSGEVACFLSHIKCWEKISLGHDEYAVVLEDDVMISDDGAAFLKNYDWIPKKSNIVKIETYNQNCFVSRIGKKVRGDRAVHKLSSWHSGTAAYIISKNKAKQLILEASGGLNCPVDFFMFDRLQGKLWNGDVYQLVPALCIQYDRLSDNIDHFNSMIKHTTVKPNDFKGHGKNLTGKITRELSRIAMKLLNKRGKIAYR